MHSNYHDQVINYLLGGNTTLSLSDGSHFIAYTTDNGDAYRTIFFYVNSTATTANLTPSPEPIATPASEPTQNPIANSTNVNP